MKPHPRIRKTIKWGGLALTVVAMILSAPLSLGISHVHPGATFADDCFVAAICAVPVLCFVLPSALRHGATAHKSSCLITIAAGFAVIEFVTYLGWVPFYEKVCGAPPAGFVCFEVGLMFVATMAGFAVREIAPLRPLPPHLCTQCNYDRTGLASGGACPECGTVPTGSTGGV